jgi:hypothetical protein
MQEVLIKSKDPTCKDQVIKFYNKLMHNTVLGYLFRSVLGWDESDIYSTTNCY